jgi:hypothetical protein
MTPDDYNFVGNVIGFIVLAGKTLYDLVINPKQHRKDLKTLSAIDSAARKRERADFSTALTFGLLAISYVFFFLPYFFK